jgi:hypothetical protein
VYPLGSECLDSLIEHTCDEEAASFFPGKPDTGGYTTC